MAPILCECGKCERLCIMVPHVMFSSVSTPPLLIDYLPYCNNTILCIFIFAPFFLLFFASCYREKEV